MNKKKFVIAALNFKDKIFMIYIKCILESIKIIVYLLQEALITLLDTEKINIPTKYFNFIDVFLFEFRMELPEYIGINNYLINLANSK